MKKLQSMSACQCHNSPEAEHNKKKFNLGGEITLRKDIIKNGKEGTKKKIIPKGDTGEQ